ncbi:MAG: hypothetical protein PHG00_03335 [Methylococcales bacterium]|nr:hypothetical protein [Methylococcales bacterium]
MNKKAKFICLFAVSGLFCADIATAGSVVVNGDLLYYTSANTLNLGLAPGASLSGSCAPNALDPIPVANATANSDIAISGLSVFVRTGESVTTVTIPSCLADASHSVGECIAFVDSVTGNLTIPCVEYQGTIYDALLVQRGSSSNWELISALPNIKFGNFPTGNR